VKNLKLPIIKKPIPKSKQLSMNDYLRFVYLNLRYTVNKKVYKKDKNLLAVKAPFSLKHSA